jgi:hypothetical protein
MSCAWSPSERKSFFERMAEYWPGSVVSRFQPDAADGLVNLWLEEIGSFPLSVALKALRWLKSGEETNRAPTMKTVRLKCQEVNMSDRGEENLPPRQAKIKKLVTECDGGRIIGHKGGTWEIGASGLLRVEAGRRWTWHTCLVWGQIPTEDLLRIRVEDVEMPEQMTWEEFKRRTGYTRPHPVAIVNEAFTPPAPKEPGPDSTEEIAVPDPTPEEIYEDPPF